MRMFYGTGVYGVSFDCGEPKMIRMFFFSGLAVAMFLWVYSNTPDTSQMKPLVLSMAIFFFFAPIVMGILKQFSSGGQY